MDSETGGAPDPAALDRVRRDLADLGADADSAPAVPPEVIDRVVGALREQPGHSIARPRLPRLHLLGMTIGVVAALIAAVLGVVMLTRQPAPRYPPGPTAQQMTVSRPATGIPLAIPDILGLLSRPPDYGPLADPQRLRACLDGLGYPPATEVLGARLLNMHGKPAVLLLLPGPAPDTVVAAAVEPTCDAAHPGLVANTAVTRP